MRMCHFQVRNGPFVLNFFGTNHYYYCHLPIGPFHCAKFKNVLQQIQSYEDAPFLGPQWSICPPPPQKFFLENYGYHSHLPISLFHCAKFQKNFSCGSRVTRVRNFWAQNGPFLQMRIFSENLDEK